MSSSNVKVVETAAVLVEVAVVGVVVATEVIYNLADLTFLT